MKRMFNKRWHRLPVAIIAVALLVCLVAGGAVYAGYGFFKANITATVEEAIYPSYGWTTDDLFYTGPGWTDPTLGYMIPEGGVVPRITADPEKFRSSTGFAATFTIGPQNDGDPDGSDFVAGEQLVIPFNLRNRGDAPLTVGVECSATTGLTLKYAFETNTTGAGYKATGSWADLSTFTAVLAPHGGSFGSAQVGAQVLFIKITAPTDGAPGEYTVTVTFTRG